MRPLVQFHRPFRGTSLYARSLILIVSPLLKGDYRGIVPYSIPYTKKTSPPETGKFFYETNSILIEPLLTLP